MFFSALQEIPVFFTVKSLAMGCCALFVTFKSKIMEITSYKYILLTVKTQNILTQNTMSHIDYPSIVIFNTFNCNIVSRYNIKSYGCCYVPSCPE